MSEAPEVELTTSDGRTVACRMERYPGRDRPEGDPRGQVTYWKAVPEQQVELQTCDVHVISLPPRTAFFVDVPQAGLMESMGPEQTPGGSPG